MPTESYSHMEKQTTQPFPQRALGSSPDGCYIEMGIDALEENVVLDMPLCILLHSPPMGFEVQDCPPSNTPTSTLRPCIGVGAGFATVQPPGADLRTLVTPDLTWARAQIPGG
ncbi:Hypothetical predicted protein [Marmota monax]|uniref:Uncharacterized protein n=1 Tax=Marmota monax TaxID=9995 RepID=A0A5E4BFE0_MARMO|nr:hypothetical protein GHT09_000958 [Marmota monax]VTJ67302.1 Hypothetical predicted protein [Marmota monax]